MQADVVIATRGRASEVRRLVELLDRQSRPARTILVVGTSEEDLPDGSTLGAGVRLSCLISPRPGLPAQRNYGVDQLGPDGDGVVVFFDDDFRPAHDWIERCCAHLEAHPEVDGVTGCVLADGTRGAAISEEDAARLNSAPIRGRASPPSADGLYGCNMAIRAGVFATCRFDEDLPLYGWLEDADMSGQIRRMGRGVERASELRGVHLGSKGGRVSGLQYGYSQIANPIYLSRKGTFRRARMVRFVAQAMIGNLVRAPREHPLVDYRGRLRGNLRAVRDLAADTLRPTNILGMR